MADVPITRYVRTGDGGSVAYQISGAGPVDLLVLGAVVPLDLLSEDPSLVRVRRRLDAFSRNVWVEQRGWGSSDREIGAARGVDDPVTDEQVTAVADAVGLERSALFAMGVAGPWAIRYVAAHSERVSALILYGSFASYVRDEQCPWGWPLEFVEQQLSGLVAEGWGTGSTIDFIAPSRRSDDQLRAWYARCERLMATPSYAGERLRSRFLQDVRDRLSAIRVPTLVMHRSDDALIRVEAGRYLAEHIDGAKYVELPGADNWVLVGDSDAVVDEIEEFLTGRRTGGEGDVVVSTVLFTDIVDSTRQAASVGHRAWSNLTHEHETRVRHALDRHRGREIKTMGDGFLATFDSAGRAIRCAIEIVRDAHGIGLEVRAGIHTGEVEFRSDDVTGLAVTIGKRVCDLAAPGQILVTESVRGATIGTTIELDDTGEQTLKGVPGTMHLFTVKP